MGGGKGRRKGGGKGRGFGGKGGLKLRGKGGGKGRRVARPTRRPGALRGAVHPRSSLNGAPPPLPEDPTLPFLRPTPRPLVKVPLEFNSLRHWCEVIGNNILAEFWHVFREGRASFNGFAVAAGDELIIDNAPADGFNQCLLLVDNQPRIASSQRVLGVGKVAVKLRGGAPKTGRIRSLGYLGATLQSTGPF